MALYLPLAHYSVQSVTESHKRVIKWSPEIHFWRLLTCNSNTHLLWNLLLNLLKGGVSVSRNVESFKSWFYGKSMSRAEMRFEQSSRNWQKSRIKEWKSLFPPCQEFMKNCRQWKQGAKTWWCLQWDLWRCVREMIDWERQLEEKWRWGRKCSDLHSEAAKGLQKYVLFMDSQHNCDFGQPMLAEIQFNWKSARESLIL